MKVLNFFTFYCGCNYPTNYINRDKNTWRPTIFVAISTNVDVIFDDASYCRFLRRHGLTEARIEICQHLWNVRNAIVILSVPKNWEGWGKGKAKRRVQSRQRDYIVEFHALSYYQNLFPRFRLQSVYMTQNIISSTKYPNAFIITKILE